MSAGGGPGAEILGACEFRSTRGHVEAEVRFAFQPALRRQVRVSRIEGLSIFEGDIVLGSAVEKLGLIVANPGRRWPNGRVVYDVDGALPQQDRVSQAIEHWEAKTAIRFQKRTSQTHYVLFRSGGGCFADVGFQNNGVQHVTLGTDCTAGNAIHEIGHCVGLWHEQSRKDRDQFVTVEWSNIDPFLSHNFDQHIDDGRDSGAYDYGSIMHYPKDAFAVDPAKPTLVAKNGAPIGQRQGLSAGDIGAVAALYSA